MNNDNKQILVHCYHCGNKGLQNIKGQTKQVFEDYADEYERQLIYHAETTWFMLQCPVCEKVSLYTESTGDGYEDYRGDYYIEQEVLFPQSTIKYNNVPSEIKSAFESAIKIRQIDPDICLLSLRRVLESLCKQQGASGRDLDSMISDLVEKGTLPPVYNDICWIIRILGNKAAHADKSLSLYQNEVDQVISFMQTMINYLYVLPQDAKDLRQRIENGKTPPIF